MNAQNWPDPTRPGVPMFPEREGWHVLERKGEDGFDVIDYKNGKWVIGEYSKPIARKYIVRDYKYIGPVLTPTQIAEMLAAERERCAKICDEFTPDKASIADDAFLTGRYLALAGIAEKIRNLGAAP